MIMKKIDALPPPPIPRSKHLREQDYPPELRLRGALIALRTGTTATAKSMGISTSTVQRWVTAYKARGRDAHIFKDGPCLRYEDPLLNKGKWEGIQNFTVLQKMEILEGGAAREKSNATLAYEMGFSPDTIGKWRRCFGHPSLGYPNSHKEIQELGDRKIRKMSKTRCEESNRRFQPKYHAVESKHMQNVEDQSHTMNQLNELKEEDLDIEILI